MEKPNNSQISVIVITAFVIIAFLIASGNINISSRSTESIADQSVQRIENKVAADAVIQYEIAKSQGDKMQIYVQAGMVCAAYLQAKDSVNYVKWKAIQKQDARAIGLASR